MVPHLTASMQYKQISVLKHGDWLQGNVSQESKAESDGAEDENTSTTLQQTLQEKDSQIKANEEKLKDLQV